MKTKRVWRMTFVGEDGAEDFEIEATGEQMVELLDAIHEDGQVIVTSCISLG